MRESDIEIVNCVWCSGVTLNPQTDRCYCGNELSPVTKIAPPGTRILPAGLGNSLHIDLPKKITYGAVSLIERTDGRILCVWNKRYSGWGLPGGRIEDEEDPIQAQARELYEETGLKSFSAELLYKGPHEVEVSPDRASEVYVYRVVPDASELPKEMEVGCPVTWLTREEFLQWTPFKKLYGKIFATLEPKPSVTAPSL